MLALFVVALLQESGSGSGSEPEVEQVLPPAAPPPPSPPPWQMPVAAQVVLLTVVPVVLIVSIVVSCISWRLYYSVDKRGSVQPRQQQATEQRRVFFKLESA
tara:strand:- start:2576 stop:2881 length:306 start_codon:yes stop_codon:yes gene_type:complete